MIMEGTIYCLVDARGMVHVSDAARSYADVAADCGLDDHTCQKYRYDLTKRQLMAEQDDPESRQAARRFINQWVGTPERLIQFAANGHLPKAALLDLITSSKRQVFLDACAVIEKKFTEDCAAANDPCLESGCAVEGEICLQPLLRAGKEYHKACAAQWIKIFANRRNRIDVWNN
jgi:hypothetical protein